MQSVAFQLFPSAVVDGLRACVWDIADFGKEDTDRPAHAPIDCSTLSVREETLREASSTPLTAALYSMLLASLLFDPCFYPTSQSAAASLSTLDRFLFLFTHARTHGPVLFVKTTSDVT